MSPLSGIRLDSSEARRMIRITFPRVADQALPHRGGIYGWFRAPPSNRLACTEGDEQMQDGAVSKCALVSAATWGFTLALLCMTAGLAFSGAASHHLIVAATCTIFVSGIACVMHVRIYMVRLAALVRVTAGLEPEDRSLRAVP